MRYIPVVAVAWIAACVPEESTQTEAQALNSAGVIPDAGSSEANVVVRVRTYGPGGPWFCTGILITPQIVLTANHCFTGFAPQGTCHSVATSADITIGNSIVTSSTCLTMGNVCNPVYNSNAVLLRGGSENCQNDAASDVAIIYLQEAVTPASLVAKTLGGIPVPAAPRIFEPDFLSPHHAMYGVAGYAATNTRSYKDFLSDDIDHGTQDDNSYWEIKRTDWDTDNGDSGGPLFTIKDTVNGDLRRNVIGLLSGHFDGPASSYMRWADITRHGNDDF